MKSKMCGTQVTLTEREVVRWRPFTVHLESNDSNKTMCGIDRILPDDGPSHLLGGTVTVTVSYLLEHRDDYSELEHFVLDPDTLCKRCQRTSEYALKLLSEI